MVGRVGLVLVDITFGGILIVLCGETGLRGLLIAVGGTGGPSATKLGRQRQVKVLNRRLVVLGRRLLHRLNISPSQVSNTHVVGVSMSVIVIMVIVGMSMSMIVGVSMSMIVMIVGVSMPLVLLIVNVMIVGVFLLLLL